jgi:YrbI family 3-deoxy-D-manno-octulosonate 8-phosphate phosphatase
VSVVAVIPARGGSKGLPGKNLRRVAGRSLVARVVDAARAASRIDRVFVSTDDAAIAVEALSAGAEVIDRPAAIAGDTASSESAVLHALAQLDFEPEVVAFVQATSPFIDPGDLDAAVQRVLGAREDVVFAAAETHAFLWTPTRDGFVGVNHDVSTRLRRQDRDAQFQETGAFYVMRTSGFVAAGHRFFGRVGIQEVDLARSLEVDTAAELEVAGLLAALLEQQAVVDVDALVTDFDGVHTDDTVQVDSDGRELVTVSRSDGAGIAALARAGVPVAILSSETNPVVAARGRKLGIEVLHGIDDKAAALRGWAGHAGIGLDRVAFLGNDVNDLPAMELVAWPVAVADAHPRVLAAARLVLGRRGGAGAVRELADLILCSKTGDTSFTGQSNQTTRSEQPWQF